jgi:hypothetical protein
MSFVNDPCYWREPGKETRAMAHKLTDPLARANMVEVAAAYDRMADRAETGLILLRPDSVA